MQKQISNKKKILILPALQDHIDLIIEAKKNGYHVITCDNNPENTGHLCADKSYNISLLDFKKLLQLSKEENITAVSSFSTDIGAIAAAHIASKLELSGSLYKSVSIMSNKEKFRTFLSQHNFNTPKFNIISSSTNLNSLNIKYPSIIKPIDRAGSKGVYVINNLSELIKFLPRSLSYSFGKKIIIEDYISTKFNQIHGDAIIQNGKIVFSQLGDQFFGKDEQKFQPISTVFPTSLNPSQIDKIISEIQRFIKLIDYNQGGLNIELRIGNNDEIYFIELGPRFGGNYIPKTIESFCNINLAKLALNLAIGETIEVPNNKFKGYIFQLILRSSKDGKFDSVYEQLPNDINILERYPIKKKGDTVTINNGPDNIVAVYILKAKNKEMVNNILHNISQYFNINYC